MDWSKLLEPRGNMVLVRRIARSATSGGIMLPESVANDTAGVDTALYEVLRCGRGAFNTMTGTFKEIELEPGQLVLATAMATASTEAATEGKEYSLISEADILCKVNLPKSHYLDRSGEPRPTLRKLVTP